MADTDKEAPTSTTAAKAKAADAATPAPAGNDGAQKAADSGSDSPKLEAKHRGGGSYSVMRGDEEVVPSLTKDEAEAFNAMNDAKQFDFIEERAPKPEAGNDGDNEQSFSGQGGEQPEEPDAVYEARQEKYRNARAMAVILGLPKNLRRGRLMDSVRDMRDFIDSFDDETDSDLAAYLVEKVADRHPNDIPDGTYKNDVAKAIRILNGEDEGGAFDPAADRKARAAAASRLARASARHSNMPSAPKGPEGLPSAGAIEDGTEAQNEAARRLHGG